MNFIYKSKDLNGETKEGEIESADLKSAVAVLRKRGLIIISINPKAAPTFSTLDNIFHKVNFDTVVTMTRLLATMIGAGLPLSESIDILEEQQDKKILKDALREISLNIKGGLTLSQALSKFPDIFPQLYINLVKSGESSGKLEEVLKRMADSLEKEREFRSRVKGALVYPALVIGMMGIVALIMIFFVIPRLTSLYKEASLDLPLPTKILIFTSDFFLNFWWLVIVLLVIVYIAFRRWKATPGGALAYDELILKVPIVGKIIINVTLTNFARTLGLLVSAGIPLLEAINITQNVTTNNVFRNALKSSYQAVERGLQLSTILISFGVFPSIVGQMVRVGEETGKLDEIFFRLSDYFETESDHMIKNLTVAIEPIVLVILGVGVAFLVLSIILPIYKLTTSF